MLFNSHTFALFLPVVFALYWWVFRDRRGRNVLLLISSYVFYGWWDWRFLGLIALSSLLDFSVGLALERTERKRTRRQLLTLSLVGNLGMLGVFKYYDFFAASLTEALATFGIVLHPFTLGLVLPVGISFYTFQTLSYTIDVYRRDMRAERDLVAFFAFVSFFPQLVAGPIERARELLPQFKVDHRFDPAAAADGLRQMLWGLFKKIVIADNCARLVDATYAHPGQTPGPVLALGTVLFAFQIYGDFSGYSDIAVGCARLFGFRLMRNFAFPYFSRDIAEFWRRWHISLNTWFRDYLYIPLGGSRGGTAQRARNTFAIFAVSGIWHGANWTFLAWGVLNALFFLPLLLTRRNRIHTGPIAPGRILPTARETFSIGITFGLTCLAWIFFRSRTIDEAFLIVRRILLHSTDHGALERSGDFVKEHLLYVPALLLLLFMFAVEWVQREGQHGLERLPSARPARWMLYIGLILAIALVGDHGAQQFIYFQF
ncbi:MAG: MBOAT family protein [Flavobacteriales bacterium]|nr:MBOAT family protein [Flavobacteriales bacterium]MCB9193614.1 MBOAT family protein [Flavobacteriales bacterium]